MLTTVRETITTTSGETIAYSDYHVWPEKVDETVSAIRTRNGALGMLENRHYTVSTS
jgi:hypothetical protein